MIRVRIETLVHLLCTDPGRARRLCTDGGEPSLAQDGGKTSSILRAVPEKTFLMGRGPLWTELLWAANLLSLLSGAYIVLGCICLSARLGGLCRCPLFIRQLLGLGAADFAWCLWWFVCTGAIDDWTHTDDPKSCLTYLFVLRSLQMTSVLSSVHMAMGFLAALSRRERFLRCLSKSQLAIIPVAFAFNLSYIARPAEYENELAYCVSRSPSEEIFAFQICTSFITIATIHVVAMRAWLRGVPQDIARRSIQRVSNYLAAFLLSWVVFIAGVLVIALTGGWDYHWSNDKSWWFNLRDTLSSLNGAFNACIYTVHNWTIFLNSFRAACRRFKGGWRHLHRRDRAVQRLADPFAQQVAEAMTHERVGECGGRMHACEQFLNRVPEHCVDHVNSPAISNNFASDVRSAQDLALESGTCLSRVSSSMVPEHGIRGVGAIASSSRREVAESEQRHLWALLGIDPQLLYPMSLRLQGAGCEEVNALYFLVSAESGRPQYRAPAGYWVCWSDQDAEWQITSPSSGAVVYWHSHDCAVPPFDNWVPAADDYHPAPSMHVPPKHRSSKRGAVAAKT